LTVIPALQHTGVISIAFGDWHYHALHSDGSISSYGTEPNSCGALGLGSGMDIGLPAGMLRGIRYLNWTRDGVLLPGAYFRGHRIWFQPEAEKWVKFIAGGGKDPEESAGRVRMASLVPPCQMEVSEWVEQMGEKWDKRPEVVDKDEDGLGAYFALSVAAAGWHSGALVLVNDKLVDAVSESCLVGDDHAPNKPEEVVEEKAERSSLAPPYETQVAADEPGMVEHGSLRLGRGYIWQDQDFPRLRLDHGAEMPGQIPFSDWKEPKPDWKLKWRGDGFTSGKVFGVEGWEVYNEDQVFNAQYQY